jgi:hypothetical protein
VSLEGKDSSDIRTALTNTVAGESVQMLVTGKDIYCSGWRHFMSETGIE